MIYLLYINELYKKYMILSAEYNGFDVKTLKLVEEFELKTKNLEHIKEKYPEIELF